jgi:antitoxin HicB
VKTYKYRVELEEDDEDGGWTAVVPALPGCASEGDTAEEALNNVREAAQAYVEVLVELGRPVPIESDTSVSDDAAVLVTSSVA